MKGLSWIIALLGLWEFGDIAAVLVPNFGEIQPFVWNHIIVGLILMIVGIWAARTSDVKTAKALNWIAIGAGAWLILGSFVLRAPFVSAGFWNDVVVGAIVVTFGSWVALRSPRIPS